MAVSGAFSANGLSPTLFMSNIAEEISFTVSGTFAGSVYFERATSTAGEAWSVIAGPFSAGAMGRFQAVPHDLFRMRMSGYASGTAYYNIVDGDAVVERRVDLDGNSIYIAYQSKFQIPRTLEVLGPIIAESFILSDAPPVTTPSPLVFTATLGAVVVGQGLTMTISSGIISEQVVTGPIVLFDATALIFPNTAPSAQSAAQVVLVTNDGTENLIISSVTISGDYAVTLITVP